MSGWPTFAEPLVSEPVIRNANGEVEYVFGRLNFMDAVVESSLTRNGKVKTFRKVDGSDEEIVGTVWRGVDAKVANGRLHESISLQRDGFQLVADPVIDVDFLDHNQIVNRYYKSCEQLLKNITGASHVAAFDHNVRSKKRKEEGDKLAGGNAVQGPASLVHADYSANSGRQRLIDLADPPKINDTLREKLGDTPLLDPQVVKDVLDQDKRFAIVNVWRNISPQPVGKYPLACCSSHSLPTEDLVVFEIHYTDRIGENYFAKYNDAQQWCYFPDMTRDEALLLKTYDSNGHLIRHVLEKEEKEEGKELSSFVLHSAFDDPSSLPDAPDRESIEVRCIVLY